METNNEYYSRLNDRFHGRERRLLDLGYAYKRIEELNIAVFTLKRIGLKHPHTIAAGAVIHADDRSWNDIVQAAEHHATA
jgi:hypothetical protein